MNRTELINDLIVYIRKLRGNNRIDAEEYISSNTDRFSNKFINDIKNQVLKVIRDNSISQTQDMVISNIARYILDDNEDSHIILFDQYIKDTVDYLILCVYRYFTDQSNPKRNYIINQINNSIIPNNDNICNILILNQSTRLYDANLSLLTEEELDDTYSIIWKNFN